MKHLLLTTIAAVVLVGCGDLQKPVEKVAESELESFIPKSVVKLSEEEVRKVLMLFIGQRVGRAEDDLKEMSMKFKIKSLLDWEKEGSSIAGVTEMTERTKGKMIISERVYYDYGSNLFINEQTNKNNEMAQSFGIWDAKEMTMKWYVDKKEMRGETKQIFTGPRQSTSKTKLWNRVGSKWELLANVTREFQPLASDGSHEDK